MSTQSKSGVPGWLVAAVMIVCTLAVAGGTVAMFVLPAARERANAAAARTAEGANIRHLIIAMLTYANDHDQKFPPDLGTLIAGGQIDPLTVLVPGDQPPSAPPNDPIALRAWVNENADIEYLYDDTLTVSTYHSRIVLHGPVGPGGANLGYADGRVLWKTPDEAEQLISDAKARLR